MFSQGRSRKATATPAVNFYRHCTVIFAGYTAIGVLYAYLYAACDSLPIRLSTSITSALAIEFSVSRFGDMLLSALLRTLPIFMIYLLGVREYEFFCLSRAWNFFFCFAHGMSGSETLIFSVLSVH